MNKVILIGRITKDPEIKKTPNTSILNFNLAVNRDYKDAQGQTQADFIGCVAYNKQADFMSSYCHKGDKILVDGRITTGSYKKADGTTIYTCDVTVERLELLTPKQQAQPQQQNPYQQPQPYTPQYNSTSQYNSNIEIPDEDMPF